MIPDETIAAASLHGFTHEETQHLMHTFAALRGLAPFPVLPTDEDEIAHLLVANAFADQGLPMPDIHRSPLTSLRLPTCAIHPTAKVHSTAQVWDFARVLAGAVIGEHCSIGGGTEIGRGSVIGNGTHIGANTFLPPRSTVGDNVFIGPNVTCTDDKHPRAGNVGYHAEPPTIGDGASIGAGAVILPGIMIGAHARVAAGAVVTKDVPDGVCVAGVPARQRLMPAAWDAWVETLSDDSRQTPLIEDILNAKALYVMPEDVA